MAKSGHHFPASHGFKGSTGKTQSVKGYTRSVPVKKSMGGPVAPQVGRSGPKSIPMPIKPTVMPHSSPKAPPRMTAAPVRQAPVMRTPRPVMRGAAAAYADGGPVMKTDTVGDQGNSVVKRGNPPITQFDSEHGGRESLRPGYAKGGKTKHGSFNKKPMFGK